MEGLPSDRCQPGAEQGMCVEMECIEMDGVEMDYGLGTDNRARRLIEAIEQVTQDAWKIEVWATVLQGLGSAVPVYVPERWSRCLAADASLPSP
jgi:hypothetical protein